MGLLVRLNGLCAAGGISARSPRQEVLRPANIRLVRFSLLLTVALFWCMPQVARPAPLAPAIMAGDEFGTPADKLVRRQVSARHKGK